MKHFISLVLSDGQKRQKASLPSQPLFPLVKLYNAVLDHLSAQATKPELLPIQWPLPEFAPRLKFSAGSLPPLYWNSVSYLECIESALSRLALPTDCGGWGEEEWPQQCARCVEFASSLDADKMAAIPLVSRRARVGCFSE